MITTFSGGYSIGGIIAAFTYQWLKHWRLVTLYFNVFIAIIFLVLTYFLYHDPPKILMKTCDISTICETLNKIAKFNGRDENTITQNDVIGLVER